MEGVSKIVKRHEIVCQVCGEHIDTMMVGVEQIEQLCGNCGYFRVWIDTDGILFYSEIYWTQEKKEPTIAELLERIEALEKKVKSIDRSHSNPWPASPYEMGYRR